LLDCRKEEAFYHWRLPARPLDGLFDIYREVKNPAVRFEFASASAMKVDRREGLPSDAVLHEARRIGADNHGLEMALD
jgi:hypothetical protein